MSTRRIIFWALFFVLLGSRVIAAEPQPESKHAQTRE